MNDTPSLSERLGLVPVRVIDELEIFNASEVSEILRGQPGWTMNRDSEEYANGGDVTSVIAEVTKTCDFGCEHCWVDLTKQAMSEETFEKVLQLAKATGVKRIQFSGGEPTLVSGLLKMAERAKQEGFSIELRSHGKNMTKPAPGSDKTWAEEVTKIFDKVVISIDGTAQANFKMRPAISLRRKANEGKIDSTDAAEQQFAETMAGYRALTEAAKQQSSDKQCQLVINTVVARANLHDVSKFAAYLEEEVNAGNIRVDNWHLTQVVPSPFVKAEKQSYAITDDEFWSAVAAATLASSTIPKKVKPVITEHCFVANHSGAVYINGRVVDEMGSLKDTPPEKLAEKLVEFGKKEQLGIKRRENFLSYTPKNSSSTTVER